MDNKKTQIALFVAFLLIAGGALYYGLNSGNESDAVSQERTAQKVEILKYSDYQCPACRVYHGANQQLKEEYGDMIEITYRHFPLDGFQYSRLAAHSVEAARNQGKYNEMHELIFDYQDTWSSGGAREHFIDFAEQLDLDMEQFEADLESEEIHRLVESQKQEGVRRTVRSTPTYFINGQKLQQNPQNIEQFKSIVELYMYRSN